MNLGAWNVDYNDLLEFVSSALNVLYLVATDKFLVIIESFDWLDFVC